MYTLMAYTNEWISLHERWDSRRWNELDATDFTIEGWQNGVVVRHVGFRASEVEGGRDRFVVLVCDGLETLNLVESWLLRRCDIYLDALLTPNSSIDEPTAIFAIQTECKKIDQLVPGACSVQSTFGTRRGQWVRNWRAWIVVFAVTLSGFSYVHWKLETVLEVSTTLNIKVARFLDKLSRGDATEDFLGRLFSVELAVDKVHADVKKTKAEADQKLGVIAGHQAEIETVKVEADQRLGVISGHQTEVETAMAEADERLGVIAGHQAEVERAKVEADQRLGVIAGHQTIIEKAKAEADQRLGIIAGHQAEVARAKAEADQRLGVIAGHQAEVERAKAEADQRLGIIAGNQTIIEKAKAEADQRLGIIAGNQTKIERAKAEADQRLGIIAGNQTIIEKAKAEADQRLGIIAGNQTKIEKAKAEADQRLGIIAGHQTKIEKAKAEADQRLGIIAGHQTKIEKAKAEADQRLGVIAGNQAEIGKAKRNADEKLQNVSDHLTEIKEAKAEADQRLGVIAGHQAEIEKAKRNADEKLQNVSDHLTEIKEANKEAGKTLKVIISYRKQVNEVLRSYREELNSLLIASQKTSSTQIWQSTCWRNIKHGCYIYVNSLPNDDFTFPGFYKFQLRVTNHQDRIRVSLVQQFDGTRPWQFFELMFDDKEDKSYRVGIEGTKSGEYRFDFGALEGESTDEGVTVEQIVEEMKAGSKLLIVPVTVEASLLRDRMFFSLANFTKSYATLVKK